METFRILFDRRFLCKSHHWSQKPSTRTLIRYFHAWIEIIFISCPGWNILSYFSYPYANWFGLCRIVFLTFRAHIFLRHDFSEVFSPWFCHDWFWPQHGISSWETKFSIISTFQWFGVSWINSLIFVRGWTTTVCIRSSSYRRDSRDPKIIPYLIWKLECTFYLIPKVNKDLASTKIFQA